MIDIFLYPGESPANNIKLINATQPYNAFTLYFPEFVTISDLESDAVAFSRSTGDSVTISESISNGPTKGFSDSVTMSDSLKNALGKAIADFISSGDSLARFDYGKSCADAITLADNFSAIISFLPVDYTLTFNDSVLLTDAITEMYNPLGGWYYYPHPTLANAWMIGVPNGPWLWFYEAKPSAPPWS
jgi:hypothetical protein